MTIMLFAMSLIVGLLLLLIFELTTNKLGINALGLYLLAVGLFIVTLFILFELPNVVVLTIDENKITVRNLLTRKKKDFLFMDFHSFKISVRFRMYALPYSELILLRHGDPIEVIPLVYIANLDQIVKELEKHSRNMTVDEYGLISLLRNQNN